MRPVDEIAVERACYGDPVWIGPPERHRAVVRLTAFGLSARAIAERLHCTRRTVHRIRARERAA